MYNIYGMSSGYEPRRLYSITDRERDFAVAHDHTGSVSHSTKYPLNTRNSLPWDK
jgi:hypothetical protein